MPIIKNFGFMWERDKVDWGRRGPGGRARFQGIKVGNKKRKVDFLNQMGIYVLYDKFEQPIQIGQAAVIFTRLGQHRTDHLRNRWSLFSWFGFYQVGAKDVLQIRDQADELRRQVTLGEARDEIEGVLIQVLEPRLNRKGPNWGETEEYLQAVESPDAADPLDED